MQSRDGPQARARVRSGRPRSCTSLLGLGFGIGAAVPLEHRRREGELPMTPWGFRALAGGPFDNVTPGQFTTLGSALVGVCALDVGRRAVALAGAPSRRCGRARDQPSGARPWRRVRAAVPAGRCADQHGLGRGWTPKPPIAVLPDPHRRRLRPIPLYRAASRVAGAVPGELRRRRRYRGPAWACAPAVVPAVFAARRSRRARPFAGPGDSATRRHDGIRRSDPRRLGRRTLRARNVHSPIR